MALVKVAFPLVLFLMPPVFLLILGLSESNLFRAISEAPQCFGSTIAKSGHNLIVVIEPTTSLSGTADFATVTRDGRPTRAQSRLEPN